MDAVRRQRDRFVIRLGAFVLAVFGAQGWATPERPNVLVVLTDDAGYSDPACYGGEASTPNIDRLAREGVRFRTFYTNARCSPTRASLLTGRWPTAVGVGDLCKPRLATSFPGYLGHLDPSAVTLAEVLSDAGYRTWMSGKWHLGGDRVDGEGGTPAEGEREKWPTRRGFQRFFGVVQGETGHFEPTAAHPFRRGEEVVDVPDDFYSTDAITDEAVGWIREADVGAADEEPFFLYVAYTAPHAPLEAPADLVDRYRPVFEELTAEEAAEARRERLVAAGILPAEWTPAPLSKKARKKHERWVEEEATIAAMTEAIDRGVGRLVSALEEEDELDDTLLLFLSDNGAAGRHRWSGNAPYSGRKGILEEGGVVTHLIAHWPARLEKRAGTVRTYRGHVIDVFPTVLEAAGVPVPDAIPLAGRSLLPVLEGEDSARSSPLFFDYAGAQAMIDGDWKLLIERDDEVRLHDLRSDGTETVDLSDEHPERVETMRAALAAWAKREGVLPFDVVERARTGPRSGKRDRDDEDDDEDDEDG